MKTSKRGIAHASVPIRPPSEADDHEALLTRASLNAVPRRWPLTAAKAFPSPPVVSAPSPYAAQLGVTPTARHPVPVVRHYAGPDPAPGTLTSDGGDTPWCIILGLVIGVFVGSTLGFLVCAVLMAGDRGDRQIRMVSTQSSRRSLERDSSLIRTRPMKLGTRRSCRVRLRASCVELPQSLLRATPGDKTSPPLPTGSKKPSVGDVLCASSRKVARIRRGGALTSASSKLEYRPNREARRSIRPGTASSLVAGPATLKRTTAQTPPTGVI